METFERPSWCWKLFICSRTSYFNLTALSNSYACSAADIKPTRRFRSDLSAHPETAKPDWEIYCNSIAKSILKQQDPEMLLEVRGRLYQLMSHCM